MAEKDYELAAQKVFEDLCAMLDERSWKYSAEEENRTIRFSVKGDDFPMDFVIIVDSERQLIRVLSLLPFTVPKEKTMDMAVATCIVTSDLIDGSFDYDMQKGRIYFRLTASFRSSDIGDKMFNYLIENSCYTVDRYNDRFFGLMKGMIKIDDFLPERS